MRRVEAASGTITTVAGGGGIGMDKGDGGPATSASLTPQRAVATDLAGNLFLLGQLDDGGNTRVRVVDPGGTIRTFAGSDTAGFSGDGGPAATALLSRPSALATDAQGDVFIAERSRIRKVDAAGTITTFAGTGLGGFAGDGGPATAAQISTPQALATNAAGDLLPQ